MRRLSAVIAIGILALQGKSLGADDSFRRGIDPINSKLAASIDGFLTNEGARTSRAGSFQLQLGLDFAFGLMSLKVGEEKIGDLIKHRFDLHLLGGYAVTDWAEVAADIPFTLYQGNGFAALNKATGLSEPAPAAAGLGDVRLLGKLRLLQQEHYAITVSAIAEVRIPTGADASFLGERSVVFYPHAVIEHTFLDGLRVGLDLGYRYRAVPGRYLNLYVGDELAAAVATSYDLPQVFKRPWSVSGEVLLATPSRAPLTSSASDALKTPFEILLGVKSEVWKNLFVSVGGGTGFLGESGFGREGFRLFATVGWREISKGDSGGSTVPAPVAPLDSDGDGIPDSEDACPKEPGIAQFKGCPDTDGDGIPDKEDLCPKQAGKPEYDGCPDTDGDEVPDNEDKCPDKPGPATNDGCPLQKPYVTLEPRRLVLKDSVHFDTGKASIKQSSMPILDELASVLAAHPEVKKIRIEGHTDSRGGAAFNLELSQRRSQSVVDYLTSKGIEAGRLSAKGFGLTRPIADNATALGRAKNRRVECSILE